MFEDCRSADSPKLQTQVQVSTVSTSMWEACHCSCLNVLDDGEHAFDALAELKYPPGAQAMYTDSVYNA